MNAIESTEISIGGNVSSRPPEGPSVSLFPATELGGHGGAQSKSSGAIKFLVLGPTEARQAGQAIALSGARRRALVTRLLVNAGRSISVDSLLEDVWDGHAPPAALATLQSHISQLRKVLGDRLQKSTTGYILRLDAASVDAAEFEGRVAEGASQLALGDVAAATSELRVALRLWRGGALQDVADRPWAMPEAERLEELRRMAVEQLLEARLALGEHEQVVPEAGAAVEEHPFRERRWATLMLALYRSGRQAEALRAYQRLRFVLREELGINPSPPLAALEVAVLRQDPALQATGGHSSLTAVTAIQPIRRPVRSPFDWSGNRSER